MRFLSCSRSAINANAKDFIDECVNIYALLLFIILMKRKEGKAVPEESLKLNSLALADVLHQSEINLS